MRLRLMGEGGFDYGLSAVAGAVPELRIRISALLRPCPRARRCGCSGGSAMAWQVEHVLGEVVEREFLGHGR